MNVANPKISCGYHHNVLKLVINCASRMAITADSVALDLTKLDNAQASTPTTVAVFADPTIPARVRANALNEKHALRIERIHHGNV